MTTYSASQPKLTAHSGEAGFSLVELMVGIAIGLIVLTIVLAVIANSSNLFKKLDVANQQMENGAYALNALSDDLRLGGYWGTYSGSSGSTLTIDASLSPCNSSPPSGWSGTTYPAHIVGISGGTTVATSWAGCIPTTGGYPWIAGPDYFQIRRVSTEVTTIASVAAAPTSGYYYLQSSTCASESLNPVYGLGSAGVGVFNLHTLDCTTASPLRQMLSHIYYIGGTSAAPSLVRLDLVGTTWVQSVIADGIQDLRMFYDIDTNNDGIADSNGILASAINADCAASPAGQCWANVVSAKIFVLARDVQRSPEYTDTKTYQLGSVSVGPYNDNYKRHVYSTAVRFNNPAGRRQ